MSITRDGTRLKSEGRRHRAAQLWILVLCTVVVAMQGRARAEKVDGDIWILVDTERHSLSVLRNERLLDRFDNVSIGRGGSATDRIRDDGTTPLGTFHIGRISPSARFRLFFGIDYPRPEHAKRALDAGSIDAEDYRRILLAVEKNKMPPQDTPLGGYIGIHGLGAGDKRIHDELNWTEGCIALTNEQVARLSRWIFRGMRVEVR